MQESLQKVDEGYIESKHVIAGIKHDLTELDDALDYYQVMANNILKDKFDISAVFSHQQIGDFRRDKTAVLFTCYEKMLGEEFYKTAKANPHSIYNKLKVMSKYFDTIRIERS